MSLFSRVEMRASVAGSKGSWDTDVERPTRAAASGQDVNPDRARTLVAVWSCQSLIADGVASLPIDTFRKDKAKGKRVPLDNPAWLNNPNAFETPYTFKHKVMVSLLGEDGNAFILTPRDGKGQITALFVLDPVLVQVDENSPVPLYRMGGEEYTASEILHIPAFTKPGQRRGLSVIDHAREAIGLGLAAEEFGARFYSQGTTLSGVVEHPGNPKPGEVAVLARMLRKSHAGIKNSHAVGILTGGATWKSISVTPDQAQFLETRRFQNIQIAQLYRVPPHLIDPSVTSSWGTGVEEQNKFFVDYTLMSWLTRLEQAFSGLLPNGQYVKFNLDARLRAKTAERYLAYVSAVNNGIMSLDEVRALEDLEPIPGGKGKKFHVPMNLQELGKEPEKPAEPAPAEKPAESEAERAYRHLPGKHNQATHGNWKKFHPEYGAPELDVNAGFGEYRGDDTYRKLPSKPIRKSKTEVPPNTSEWATSGRQPAMTHAKGAHVFKTDEERREFWADHAAEWQDTLDEDGKNNDEYEACQTYTGGSYHAWNSNLRQGEDHMSDTSKRASDSMRGGVVEEDAIVYRGAESGQWSSDMLKPGKFFHEKGFTSTSTSHEAAFDGDIVMRIRVPKGARAAAVEDLSLFPNERELVIPAGATYKVHAVHYLDGKMYVDMTLTHQGKRPRKARKSTPGAN